MKRSLVFALLVASLAAGNTVAYGHPGHGLDGGSDSLWHYLTDPLHLTCELTLALVGAGLLGRRMFRKRKLAPVAVSRVGS